MSRISGLKCLFASRLTPRRNFATARLAFAEQSPFTAGQPLHETRPHTISPGELTPGISALEYFQRRICVSSSMTTGSVAIIPGEQIKYASGSVFFPFQQDNDFYYLTGWNEPNSVAIIEKPTANPDDVVFHLVVPPKDPAAEQWEGHRTGPDGAVEIFNADVSESSKVLDKHIQKVLQKYRTVYYDFQDHKSSSLSSVVNSFFKKQVQTENSRTIESLLKQGNKSVRSLRSIVSNLRAVKSEAELSIMRLAGKISGRAYNAAYARRFKTEKALCAFLEYRFISGGCDKSAYVPVVAGGANSLCIHYTRNDDLLRDGELVLVDAGGSLGGYAADISRTWPVSGKFTDPQKDLYEAVLSVNKHCIKLCTESAGVSIQDLHYESVRVLTRELRNCGFAQIQDWETSRLYPHYIGHNLGLDVHDVPSYPRSGKFKSGQVVTVEPGVYVPDNSKWPKHFRNIGIRIEDDVAVGKNTYTVLTSEAAKEVVDIEAIAQNGVTTPLEEEVVDIWSL
ncbi:unnamed protein product [Kuraishia capsulata CBS 1993]|uniref:Aminopeptidase P N-terminal domain-containing protein n=1 Tax=Kuraishia capsulata CBS 1993 TaxID=1382522 RepID=W6MK06_9ASCO|nr:uncharacterized protein KUCA_T00000864001 [Kuraishia capsulata CBS 1993]CDK24897.1 unnamed protein product [Kuraishia capsulata CBS 1993]